MPGSISGLLTQDDIPSSIAGTMLQCVHCRTSAAGSKRHPFAFTADANFILLSILHSAS